MEHALLAATRPRHQHFVIGRDDLTAAGYELTDKPVTRTTASGATRPGQLWRRALA